MESIHNRYGEWAVVAGAAEGLGKAFCRELASRGFHLVMIDIIEERLYQTALEIEDQYKVNTKKLLADLSDLDNLSLIFEAIEHIDCRLLVYNAAYGPVRRFLDNSTDEIDKYIDLNCRMPIHLVYHFVKNIPEGKNAGVILMSSLAGLIGTNLVAPYGATKAFNWNLAEGLYHELKPRGIDVMACCAGATDTPNYRNTHPNYGIIKPNVADPGKVARSAVSRLGGSAVYVPGWQNRMTWFLLKHLMPGKWSAALMNRTMYKMYKENI